MELLILLWALGAFDRRSDKQVTSYKAWMSPKARKILKVPGAAHALVRATLDADASSDPLNPVVTTLSNGERVMVCKRPITSEESIQLSRY